MKVSARKTKSDLYNHPNWNVENYDLTRYFVEVNGQFPNNTCFMGNNFSKGFISFEKLKTKLEDAGGELLFKSTTYNLGTRKYYVKLDTTFLLMEGIHYKKGNTFLGIPEEDADEYFSVVGNLTILHPEEDVNKDIMKIIEESILEVENVPMIGIISRDNSGFYLSEIKMETKISHEMDLHYGENFTEFHNKLIDKLAFTNKGLTLLHGDPGTGKSSYIRKLIYDLKQKTNKKIIIVPNNMISYLVDPEFNTFLLETLESYQYEEEDYIEELMDEEKEDLRGMILILEDSESVLLKRETGYNNQGTSNILNLTDGLLNDIFGIQIIATYNTDDDNIDSAIKRSKRLIAKRKFKKLTVDNAKKLAQHIGVADEDLKVIKNTMSVADVYALLDKETEDILIDKDGDKKGTVGFNLKK